jgi:hypothetical protein
MQDEPMILQCLAGRLDNPTVPLEEKQYIVRKIRDNDLAEIRDVMLTESHRSENIRNALAGPLPSQAQIEAWLGEWGDRYLPYLDPDVFARMKQAQEPSRQAMGCAVDWVVTVLILGASGTLAYIFGWWVPLVPVALMALYTRAMFTATRSTELKGEAKRRAMWAHATPFTRSLLAFFGSLAGLAVRFVVWLMR